MEADDFSHLVPVSAQSKMTKELREEVDGERKKKKQHRFVVDILKSMGVYSKNLENEQEFLDFIWFWDKRFVPIPMHHVEIQKFDIIDLFVAPTKTEVYREFKKELDESYRYTRERFLIMPFSVRNLKQRSFCIHNSEEVKGNSKVYTTFLVRNEYHYVQLWKEVVDAIKRTWGVETEGF